MARAEFRERPPNARLAHWNSGWVITPTSGGAKGRLYYLRVNVSTGRPVVGGSGHYEDVYVKTSDGWRIKERRGISDTGMHWATGQ